ncbi:hypothetical protein BDQ12DRAFT_456013 [Crucibulum laeve]|uniref:Uncharacterized protein n=1 Tax=Crucibulum laeve TaxID=68775 RepID=A0A5C3M747_9AGAR|nr:hypothetical protein BDQ12DRAFT_456013 [Crucibulum laeve]
MSSKDDHTLHSRYKVELLEGLRTTLSVVKDAAGNVGVPGLQAGIGGLGVIIDAGLTLLDNSESAERLLQRISELDAVIQNVKGTTEEHIPQAVFARLNRLSQQWQIKGEEIQALQSRSIARRFFGSKKDADAIQMCMNSISESIHAFNVCIIHFSLLIIIHV